MREWHHRNWCDPGYSEVSMEVAMNPWVVVGIVLIIAGTLAWLSERRRLRRVGRPSSGDVATLAARRRAHDDATGGAVTRHPS